MKNNLDRVVIYILLVIFVVLYFFIYNEKQSVKVTTINIEVVDSDSVSFITEEEILADLKSEKMRVWHENFSDCDVNEIENYISSLDFVDSVNVYKQVEGIVNIYVTQKEIWGRIITPKGDDYYISSDFDFFKTKNNFVANVPVVSCSGHLFDSLKKNEKKSDVNYLFLQNLFNFVKLVEKDPFWKKLISQIDINEKDEVELISRVGMHTIVLCDKNDMGSSCENIRKLKGFYSDIMPKKGWGNYNKINLKFKDLVVISNE